MMSLQGSRTKIYGPGTANQGPNGPLNPVPFRDARIESRISFCFGVISSNFGPSYLATNPDEVSTVVSVALLLLLILLLFEEYEEDKPTVSNRDVRRYGTMRNVPK